MHKTAVSSQVKQEVPAPSFHEVARNWVDVSVIVPVFNERDNLMPLYSQLIVVLTSLELTYEVIFVDDGSTDGGTAVLRELATVDPRVRVIEFVRNFGQTAAMAAGFEHAQGEIIIPIDADLQNDPADIPLIMDKLDEGYDVVSCWRKNRKDEWFRVFLSRVANKLISWIVGVHLHDYGCTLKAYRHHIVQHIRLYGEMHRFIPVFAHWAGARVTEINVRHHPRHRGQTKYGNSRTFKVLLDLITIKFLGSFSTKPMYLFGGLGFLSFFTGSMLSALTLYQRFFEQVRVHRNPLLILSIFAVIVGVQFILFGLLAELIIRTYHESQSKPTYIIRDPKSGNEALTNSNHSRLAGQSVASRQPQS